MPLWERHASAFGPKNRKNHYLCAGNSLLRAAQCSQLFRFIAAKMSEPPLLTNGSEGALKKLNECDGRLMVPIADAQPAQFEHRLTGSPTAKDIFVRMCPIGDYLSDAVRSAVHEPIAFWVGRFTVAAMPGASYSVV